MRIDSLPRLVQPQPVDYGVVRGLCTALCGRYPCLQTVCAGSSLLGRELPVLVLNAEAQPHPQRVLVAAAFHGQEWLTALCALRLCEELCASLTADLTLCDIAVGRALQGRQIWFFPLINPDGVHIARYGSAAAGEYASFVAQTGGDTHGLWQANARGVDINHNFNAGWAEMQALAQKNGKTAAGPRQYSGPSPESEPETRAVTNLCRQWRFRHVVALHSQGEEIYWSYGDRTPPQSRIMAQVLGAASGYTVTHPEGMASHGGFKDWFIACYGRPGFTIELGRGVNPLPIEDFESIYEKAREMLVLSALL
ncbi:MAG: M14 family metallocarboxypeptidase [Clostridia bacterium]|nr:M14 family metallocarboxypeptidase [Clostridia bacterium]